MPWATFAVYKKNFSPQKYFRQKSKRVVGIKKFCGQKSKFVAKITWFLHDDVAVVCAIFSRRLSSNWSDQSGSRGVVEVVAGVVGYEVLHGPELDGLVDEVGLLLTIY